MKKFILLSAVCTMFASCTSKEFTIKGQLNGEIFNGKTVYLVNRFGEKDTLAKAVIENGQFTITDTISGTTMCTLTCDTGDRRTTFRSAVIIEQGQEYTMMPDSPIIQGGKLQQVIADFAKNNYERSKVNYRERELIKKDTTLSQEEISKKVDSLNKIAVEKNYSTIDSLINIKQNDFITAYLMTNVSRLGKNEEFKKLYEGACEMIKSDKFIKSIYENILKEEKSSVGKMFIDFTIENGNLDGTPAKLSDYVGKGKYILVDFWASWCGPCKREIPFIKEVYDKYHGDKFDVLSVAVNDKREETLKAAKEHGVTWNQIVDAQELPCELYSISGIPTLILFAPDGTIIDRKVRGYNGTLKAKVAELLEK